MSTKTTSAPVIVATDLTDASIPALVRAKGHADAIGAPLLVCHVIPDVLRHHPLLPVRGESDLALGADLTMRAAEMATEQVCRVLKISADDFRVVVETGTAEEEIIRIAEAENAPMIVIGAKPREGMQRILGHVAERVVRYSHTSVLIARTSKPTGKILVPTDFGEGTQPALVLAEALVKKIGLKVALLHVTQTPTSFGSLLSPLGSVWMPPSATALDELQKLGKDTLDGLAKQYGAVGSEQVEGDPADVIVERAEALDAEMIIMGSRGRTGIARLVLGSVAEKVIRNSHCSVLIAR